MAHEPDMVRQSVALFGGVYIGVELPLRAQDQDIWDVPAKLTRADAAGSWGGHAIFVAGYDTGNGNSKPENGNPAANVPSPVSNFGLTCISWGQPKKMTWAWFARYCSEAYALISPDWLTAAGVSPGGLNSAALEADLAVVTA